MIGNSLTDKQVTSFSQDFANNLPSNTKLLQTQISKIIQLDGFLGRVLGSLMKASFPLMKNVIRLLAKCLDSNKISRSSVSNRCSYSK